MAYWSNMNRNLEINFFWVVSVLPNFVQVHRVESEVKRTDKQAVRHDLLIMLSLFALHRPISNACNGRYSYNCHSAVLEISTLMWRICLETYIYLARYNC
jgi:hypothetical protein